MKFGRILVICALTMSSSAFAADLPTKKAPPAPLPPLDARLQLDGLLRRRLSRRLVRQFEHAGDQRAGGTRLPPRAGDQRQSRSERVRLRRLRGVQLSIPLVLRGARRRSRVRRKHREHDRRGLFRSYPLRAGIEDGIPTYNKLSEPWVFRARARLGWAMGPLLPFIAGGLSVTQAKLDLTFPCPNFPRSGHDDLHGQRFENPDRIQHRRGHRLGGHAKHHPPGRVHFRRLRKPDLQLRPDAGLEQPDAGARDG